MTTNPPTLGAVGTSAPRIDGITKVTGSAQYSADIDLPGALWGRVARSPFPHAHIKRIDVAKALALPGVHSIITHTDVGNSMTGRRIFDQPLLARELVRFVGEPVAAVAAVDEETARRAVGLIEVDYEELPALYDPLEAAKPGAPILHPDFNSYTGVKQQPTPSNIYATTSWGTGEPDTGFAEADETIEGTYTTALMHQAYMESHTCAVRIGDDGRVEVWASNKAPHYIKGEIAFTAGLEEDQVRVLPAAIGGDFGGKGSQMNIPIAYFLAKASGKPIRMIMDYTEELTASNPRHPSTLHVKAGVKRDGTIVACEIVGYFNTGAYAGFVPLGFLPGPRHAVGPYRIPHCNVTAHHVYTNKVPSGHMRGPGEPQAIFAMESHIDVIAQALSLDPADVRFKNVIREGDVNGLAEEFHHIHGVETIEAALDASGYRTAKPAGSMNLRYGRGIGIGERAPGGGETHASVAFERDGSVTVHTSIFEQGSGTYTTMQQMVAEVLSMPTGRVWVMPWDTDSTGFDSGAGASRNTRMASEAAYEAAHKAKDSLLGLAADLLSWPEANIVLENGELRRSDFDQSILVAELLARTGVSVEGRADYKDPTHAHVTAFTVQVAEVSVDIETGEVNLFKMTSVHDAGKVLNPQGHDGQIFGGVVQGIGYGLVEELPMLDGRVTSTSFADYKFPNIADIPEMQAITRESEGGVGPFNIKGIGENPLSPVAPAIANAIADAVGVRIRDLPLSAEKVYSALNKLSNSP